MAKHESLNNPRWTNEKVPTLRTLIRNQKWEEKKGGKKERENYKKYSDLKKKSYVLIVQDTVPSKGKLRTQKED
jgi:hypothetical protein